MGLKQPSVENLFVKNGDQSMLANSSNAILQTRRSILGGGYHRRMVRCLESDPKRKVAISPGNDGWFAIVESKESWILAWRNLYLTNWAEWL
jgi:hypothetical protein